MINRFEKIENEKFIEIFNTSESKGEICRKLNMHNNGKSMKYINAIFIIQRIPRILVFGSKGIQIGLCIYQGLYRNQKRVIAYRYTH